MPKVKSDERFTRVIKFLSASREKKIANLLMRRGFTKEDADEGWALLDRAAGRHQALEPDSGTFMTEYKPIIDAIDAWENTWFDVAKAALDRSYPEVSKELFKNLGKSSGKLVVISVRTFIDRYQKLVEDNEDQKTKAIALLSQRGLTTACIDEVNAKLALLELIFYSLKKLVQEKRPVTSSKKSLALQMRFLGRGVSAIGIR